MSWNAFLQGLAAPRVIKMDKLFSALRVPEKKWLLARGSQLVLLPEPMERVLRITDHGPRVTQAYSLFFLDSLFFVSLFEEALVSDEEEAAPSEEAGEGDEGESAFWDFLYPSLR